MASGYPTYSYLGLEELGDTPHLIVDGAARPRTTLVLSHWPASPTPEPLWRDLSAEIAEAYLNAPDRWDPTVDAVSNDHADIDGLISLFFLTNPDVAMEHSALLVEVARIGDFGVVHSRRAAEIAWALEALIDAPELVGAELSDAQFAQSSRTTLVYRSLLAAMQRLIEHPDVYAPLIGERAERFDTTSEQIAAGDIVLTEFEDIELAVFSSDVDLGRGATRVGREVATIFDPFALHTASDMARVLVSYGRRFALYDRYETWVRFVSRRHLLRRDLQPLAVALSETDVTTWSADAANCLEPMLYHGETPSARPLDSVVDLVRRYLYSAPVAWDPFRTQPLVTSGGAAANQT